MSGLKVLIGQPGLALIHLCSSGRRWASWIRGDSSIILPSMPQKKEKKKLSHRNRLSFRKAALHFPSFRLKACRLHPKYEFSLFWGTRQGQSMQVNSALSSLSLCTLKRLMKATHPLRQSSARLRYCLCVTQLESLRINCIICHPFLWSDVTINISRWQVRGAPSPNQTLTEVDRGSTPRLQSVFYKTGLSRGRNSPSCACMVSPVA